MEQTSPNWFKEDKDLLEKVLLELWPSAKATPRKMYEYVESVRGFYPGLVNNALSAICREQEFDRRPTIKQLLGKCRELVGKDYTAKTQSEDDCRWCGYIDYVYVGLYEEPAAKCEALSITDKNVLKGKELWVVRPDWGKELDLTLKQYLVHCPRCAPPEYLTGCRSADRWSQVYLNFTTFEIPENGGTQFEWDWAARHFYDMINKFYPDPPVGEKRTGNPHVLRFTDHIMTLPELEVVDERKLNVIQEGDEPPREESVDGGKAAEGEILPIEDTGLPEGLGLSSGDSGEDAADSDQGRQGGS